jgi:putative FmdB family regulatory protein
MPVYEFQCDDCRHISGIYFRSTSDTPAVHCRHCGSDVVHKIMSSFTSPLSEHDKMARLDSKYEKQVDQALAKAPADSHPDYYMRKMVPFSRAKSNQDA